MKTCDVCGCQTQLEDTVVTVLLSLGEKYHPSRVCILDMRAEFETHESCFAKVEQAILSSLREVVASPGLSTVSRHRQVFVETCEGSGAGRES